MQNKYTEIMTTLTKRELRWHLLLTQIILIFLSLLLGLFLFDRFSEFQALLKWHETEQLVLGVTMGMVVVGLDLVLMKRLPPSYYDDGGINEKIFSGATPLEIAVISLTVAISEELLFRGVLQTHFGLVFTSILFALIHYRYLFKWYLFLNITVLSFILGFVFKYTNNNLLVTVLMHFIIDFLLGIYISKKSDAKRK